jgi:opacity protein-like surface antigen
MESGSGFKIGPRATIALGDLSDAGADFAIGADVRYDLSANVDAPIQLAGSFDFYFAEDIEAPDPQGGTQELSQTIFAVDLNGHYMIPTEGTFSPYAGVGLGIVRSSQDEVEVDTPFGTQTFGGGSNTDVGLNLVGGAEFETGSVRPFAQAQVSLGGDFTRFGITGGVLFSL